MGAQGGRTPKESQKPVVSKTGGCRFESCRPCTRKPRNCGAFVSVNGNAGLFWYRLFGTDSARTNQGFHLSSRAKTAPRSFLGKNVVGGDEHRLQKPRATSIASTRTTARLRRAATQSQRSHAHRCSGRGPSERVDRGGAKVEYRAAGPIRFRIASAASRRPDTAIGAQVLPSAAHPASGSTRR